MPADSTPSRHFLATAMLAALLSLSACGGGGDAPTVAPPAAVTPPAQAVEGQATVLAGAQYDDTAPGQFVNGPAATARFYRISDLAMDKAGNVFVADGGNCAIRKITPGGTVSTLAGGQRCATPDGDAARFDGSGAVAAFYSLGRMVIDAGDNLYVADGAAIRKITPQGVVATLAGQFAEGSPIVDGAGVAARFYGIRELAVAPDGSLLVKDATLRPAVAGHDMVCVESRGFNYLREISPQGVVTTWLDTGMNCVGGNSSLLAGLTNIQITRDGTLYARRDRGIVKRSPGSPPAAIHDLYSLPGPPYVTWERAQGPVPDDVGNLYFIGDDSNTIVKLAPDGTVSKVLQGGYPATESVYVGQRVYGLRAITYVGKHDFIFSTNNQIMRVTLQ